MSLTRALRDRVQGGTWGPTTRRFPKQPSAMDAPSNAGKHLAAHRMLSDMQNRLWNVAALRHLRARSASKTSQGGMPFYAIEMARRGSRSPVRVTAASNLGVLSPDLFPPY